MSPALLLFTAAVASLALAITGLHAAAAIVAIGDVVGAAIIALKSVRNRAVPNPRTLTPPNDASPFNNNANTPAAQLLAALLEEVTEGVMITDADGAIRLVNRALMARTGFGHDELVGAKPSILRSGRHDEAYYAAMWHALASSGNWQGTVWNRRRDGERYAEALSITAIRGPDGRISHYLAIYGEPSRNSVFHMKDPT